MKIKKLEIRKNWVCEVNGHSYVRTEIEWRTDEPITITWHLNEDNRKELYITNDEEIKIGDWILDAKFNLVDWAKYDHKDLSRDWSKIILTTDPKLIEDGVQAIDDEFLEWICNNASCEEIEVVDDTLTVKEMSSLPLGTRNHKYKIIIPKEIGFKVENGKRTETFL